MTMILHDQASARVSGRTYHKTLVMGKLRYPIFEIRLPEESHTYGLMDGATLIQMDNEWLDGDNPGTGNIDEYFETRIRSHRALVAKLRINPVWWSAVRDLVSETAVLELYQRAERESPLPKAFLSWLRYRLWNAVDFIHPALYLTAIQTVEAWLRSGILLEKAVKILGPSRDITLLGFLVNPLWLDHVRELPREVRSYLTHNLDSPNPLARSVGLEALDHQAQRTWLNRKDSDAVEDLANWRRIHMEARSDAEFLRDIKRQYPEVVTLKDAKDLSGILQERHLEIRGLLQGTL